MKREKVKDFIALDAQKLVRDCEEYLEEEKALELDLKEAGRRLSKERNTGGWCSSCWASS